MTVRETAPGWDIQLGNSPVVGTAIHAGSRVREECGPLMCLAEAERLREEDPFTDLMIQDFPNRIVVRHSRFEVDLNRGRDEAVYLTPEQAWGLHVWQERPSDAVVAVSLAFHDAYYDALKRVLAGIEGRFGRFVVIDVHSYNHRRGGADAVAADPKKAPDVNIGTFSMDRAGWAPLVDAFMETLRQQKFKGKPLDVRENISFQGKGEQTRFIHQHFPQTGCAIAVEFKKIFMDEWTGQPDHAAIGELRRALTSTVPVLEQALRDLR
ncbi:MAG: N-formylglutamate amidohydrolase [Rhizobiaceae bacterium]